jgi:hypothetical protein
MGGIHKYSISRPIPPNIQHWVRKCCHICAIPSYMMNWSFASCYFIIMRLRERWRQVSISGSLFKKKHNFFHEIRCSNHTSHILQTAHSCSSDAEWTPPTQTKIKFYRSEPMINQSRKARTTSSISRFPSVFTTCPQGNPTETNDVIRKMGVASFSLVVVLGVTRLIFHL